MTKRLAAGVVVVRADAPSTWRVLILRAYRNWDFPKGIVEPGESPRDAAVREVLEEASLGDLVFRWGDDFRDTAPYAGGKVARYYVAESPAGDVALPIAPELGRPEHHEYRWLPFGDARRLLPERLVPILDWARAIVEAR